MRLLPFCAFLLIMTGLVLSEEEGENTEPDHQPKVEEPHISVEPAVVIEDVPVIKSPEFLETQNNIDEDADDEGGDDILLPLHGGPLNRDRGLPGSFGPHGPNQGRKHHRHHHHRLWNHHHNYHHYFPHHNHTDCCLTKKVGEHHYHLADGFCGKARDFDCSSDCCYTRENYDKERWFCFKDNEEGLLVSDCVKDHYSHEFHSSESSSEEGVFTVYVSARKNFTLYANGTKVLSGKDWTQTYRRTLDYVPAFLAIKTVGGDEGEKGIHVRTSTGLQSDATWQCGQDEKTGWTQDPSVYSNAAVEIDPDWASSEEIHNLPDHSKWIWFKNLTSDTAFCVKSLTD